MFKNSYFYCLLNLLCLLQLAFACTGHCGQSDYKNIQAVNGHGRREYETYISSVFLPLTACLGHFGQSFMTERQKKLFNSIEKYLSLIPKDRQCQGFNCSNCHHAWQEMKGYICDEEGLENDEGEFECETYYWTCSCKEKSKKYGIEDRLPTWTHCREQGIFPGYLDETFIKYFSCFEEYLEYVNQNSNCTCFWPEISKKSLAINNIAYKLFFELFRDTSLSKFASNKNLQEEFFLINNQTNKLDFHGLAVICISHSFFFSDYDWICKDLEIFSRGNFSGRELALILSKLDKIRETLTPLFLDLYQDCLQCHYSNRIANEIFLITIDGGFSQESFSKMRLLFGNEMLPANFQLSDSLKEDIESDLFHHNFLSSVDQQNISPTRPTNWLQSDIALKNGASLNELLLYKEAIAALSEAIKFNPLNRDAYIERAAAYFETNQASLALKDFESAKKLSIAQPFKLINHKAMLFSDSYVPENKLEFSKGLVSGTVDGAKVSSIEFVPSILSCCRGISNGLWAFVCSPLEVSQEMVDTTYAIGEFIRDHSTEECFQCVVPELKELSLSWDKLNDLSKGQKIGFIIGKYGVDIFAPIGALKGIRKVQALKRANTMCTLESCAASQVKHTKILEESAKRAALRELFAAESIKKGKILTKSSNVQYHVMQPKHTWEKVLSLSGNAEEDFKRVTFLLEKESIFSKECLLRSKEFSQGKVIRSEYQKTINGHKIQAVFETYVDTNQTFLKDAWVIIK